MRTLIVPPRPVVQVVGARETLQPEVRQITAHRVAMAEQETHPIPREPVAEVPVQREARCYRKPPDAREAADARGSTARHTREVAVVVITTQGLHREAQRAAAAAEAREVPDTTRRHLATPPRRQGVQTPAVEVVVPSVMPRTLRRAQAAPALSSLPYRGVDCGPLR